MNTVTISVQGMTCENCVRHVTQALQELPGVTGVEVALASGSATVQSDRPLERAALAHALDEAGYTLS